MVSPRRSGRNRTASARASEGVGLLPEDLHDDDLMLAPPTHQGRKRGRKAGPDSDAEDDADKAMEQADEIGISNTMGDSDVPSAKRARKGDGARTLPPRSARPAHPGAPDMAARKRSSAEVSAAKAKQQEKEDLAEAKKKKAKKDLAELELDEEEADEEEERTSVKTLPTKKTTVDTNEPMDVDDDSGVSKSKKKPARGETREGVEEEKDILRAERKAEVAKKKKAELARAKRLKTASKPLSGLTPDWIDKSPASPLKSKKKQKKKQKQDEPVVSDSAAPMGGLADSDADAVPPQAGENQSLHRSNSMVVIVSSDDDDAAEEEADVQGKKSTNKKTPTAKTPAKPAAIRKDLADESSASDSESDSEEPTATIPVRKSASKVRTPKPKKAATKKATTTTSTPKPATVTAKSNSTPSTAKKTRAIVVPNADTSSSGESGDSEDSGEEPTTTASTGNTGERLPAWAQVNWVRYFLPTLFHFFAASPEPFTNFVKDEKFAADVQMILGIVYPRSSYKVSKDDYIVKAAYDRINTKRSAMGRQAIHLLESIFEKEEFVTGKARRKFCKAHLDPMGPAFYRIPTPATCKVKLGHPDFIKPVGLFESPLIVGVLAPLLRLTTDSKKDFGHPQGGVILAAAAVERALRMYESGERKSLGKFSRPKVQQNLVEYRDNTDKMGENRWQSLLAVCGVSGVPEEPKPTASKTGLHQKRRSLYIASSPPPEDQPAA